MLLKCPGFKSVYPQVSCVLMNKKWLALDVLRSFVFNCVRRMQFHGTVHHGRTVQNQFGRPATGAKMNDIMAKLCAAHFVSIFYVILVLLCGLFRCFWHFKGFFYLYFYSGCIWPKGMQSRLEWYFLAEWVKTNYIIAKHVYTCTRWFDFKIIRDRLFVV